MVKYQKFAFDNFILDEDNQPYVEDWENSHIEVEPSVEETEQIPQEENEEERAEEPVEEIIPEPEPEPELEPEPEPEPEIIEEVITFTEEEVAEKENKARTEGYEAGYQQAKSEQQEEQNRLLSEINNRLMMLSADMSAQTKEIDNQAISLSQAIIHKLIPVLEKAQAEKLVKAFLEKNFAQFKNENKLAFYFHPEALSYIQEEIAHLANIHDYEGKISLHKDETMQVSDCRVEWENGGVERSSTKMLDKADKIFEANISKD